MSKRVLVWAELGGKEYCEWAWEDHRRGLVSMDGVFPSIDPLSPPAELVEAMARVLWDPHHARTSEWQARAALKALAEWKAGEGGG